MRKQTGIGPRLNDTITKKGISQSELASTLGVTESAVSQWISGKKTPSRETIRQIADALDVRAGWLAFEDGEAPEPDYSREREAYLSTTDWSFRAAPLDGGRDYGNANLWSIPWDVDTLVREAIQNSLDAATDPDYGIYVTFSLIRLDGDELDCFLSALHWDDEGDHTGLRAHIEAASGNGHKLGTVLRDGLNRLQRKKELVLLRIDDYQTTGLQGSEDGEGNFVALMRNNLDSSKGSAYAGGSYGLGKAVFWRASRFATVFVNSNLSSQELVRGKSQHLGRMIGKSDLAWHPFHDRAFAGPGWFGNSFKVEGGVRSESVWNNRALAHDLYLEREEDQPGTSILVVGFYDAASDEHENLEKTAMDMEKAIARNFWPALVSGKLIARVRTMHGREDQIDIQADPVKHMPDLVEAFRRSKRTELDPKLEGEGDVVRQVVRLTVPAREQEPRHDSIEHEVLLVVRRDSTDKSSTDQNTVQFFRGQQMVIMEKKWSNLVFGGMPYKAFVMCGMAAGGTESDALAEQFLRLAEPPAHDKWELTADLKIQYAHGAGARIADFMQSVREELMRLIKPSYEDEETGPDALRRLLRLGIPEPPKEVPLLIVNRDKTMLASDGAWVVEAEIRLPDDRKWFLSPILKFGAETGGGKRVAWSVEALKNCTVEDGEIKIDRGVRSATFRGTSDPTSHPAPSKDTAVRVLLHRVRSE